MGEPQTKFFDRKADVEEFDTQARAGLAPEVQLDQGERHATFRDYAERWRLSRQITQALEYQDHLVSRLNHHHYPYFDDRQIRSVAGTDVLKLISGGWQRRPHNHR